jgi:TfoX/Sxy family transcriptional regulator of competence genes
MAYDEILAARIRVGLKLLNVPFEEKPMMGGLCFMVDGKMCVGVEKNRLMGRIGPEAYDLALQRKGCRPMDFTGRPMRGFVFIQAEGLTTKKDQLYWLRLALAYNPLAKKSGR